MWCVCYHGGEGGRDRWIDGWMERGMGESAIDRNRITSHPRPHEIDVCTYIHVYTFGTWERKSLSQIHRLHTRSHV